VADLTPVQGNWFSPKFILAISSFTFYFSVTDAVNSRAYWILDGILYNKLNVFFYKIRFVGLATTNYVSIYDSTILLLDLGHFFSSLILYTVGRPPWTWGQPVAKPLSTHRRTQIQNKCKQTSMPWVEFEPTIPAFEQAKTVDALDRAATVIGYKIPSTFRISVSC
jgi:hypothetical protein